MGPGLHDGHLFELDFSDGDAIHLRIRTVAESVVDVELSGIGDVSMIQFYNGAIVSALYVWTIAEAPERALQALFAGRLHSPVDIQTQASRIASEHPKGHVVELVCSYGGTILAVCDEVQVYCETGA